MLPSNYGENLDDLVLDFEEDEQEKTKTFGIYELTETDSKSTSLLGVGALGLIVLNSTKIQITTGNITSFIGAKIDDVAAVQQAIYLMLSIEADKHIIYPYTYGINTLDLIGKPIYYVMAVIPERIKETLLTDDRILDVSDFEFELDGGKLTVKFIAHTIYGDIEEETAVMY